ncbi:MAG: divergent polysaccharide deacetylase family protein [Treponema sp.]|nr:divergent polysaccharide deacetylase family protein [Treponema sp.]
MSANRESNGKKKTVRSKKRRSSARKKKPKVLLNSKYVCILCASIVFFCALLLGTAFLLGGTAAEDRPAENRPALAGGDDASLALEGGNLSSLPVQDKKGVGAGGGSGSAGGSAGNSGTAGGAGTDGNAGTAANGGNAGRAGNSGLAANGGNSGGSSTSASSLGSVSSAGNGMASDQGAAGSGASGNAGAGHELASIQKPHGPDGGILETRPKFNIPPAKNAAKLAFVIDDGGMSPANVKKYTALPFPITVAVLPGLPHTAECAALVRRDGKELMLHQPMQAKNLGINPGPGAITPDMDSWGIQQIIEKNLGELGPGVKGFNNHEGSLITEDKVKMTFIIDLAMQKGLFFLDSRTTSQTQARQAALELDTHIIERNAPFLDNAVNREEMLAEIYKGLEVANRDGFAVIIGHVDKSAAVLPKLLEELYPELLAKGYVFTTPSRL